MLLLHYIGAFLLLVLITTAGIQSGRKVKTSNDFSSGGGSTGVAIIAGSIVGTLVGGASTIGTAQLAFNYGFSAWWFTLGGGIGLVVMALFFAKPFYLSGAKTMSELIRKEYGKKTALCATILMSLGTFLSIVSQFLSGIALITSISHISSLAAILVILLMMMAYVMFGGFWGVGSVGILKTILLYITCLVCGINVLNLSGGITSLYNALPSGQYFSLFARGFLVDGGAGFSLVVGVLCTQTYLQALLSAKSLKVARLGVCTAGVLTLLIGIAGIFVGMFMKVHHPDIPSSNALPDFVLQYIPPFMGGIILATLLVALIGTGAGLALGLSSLITNDIYKLYFSNKQNPKKDLFVSRMVIAAILLCAGAFTLGNAGSLILSWSFMSMGLRGATVFAPVCFALFLKGRVGKRYAIIATIAGPLSVLLGKFLLPATIDPLFLGIAMSFLIMCMGLL